MTKCVAGMDTNNKTKAYNEIHQQIHHGNFLLQALTMSKVLSNMRIPASMSLKNTERKGLTQLKHHKKAASKFSTQSSTGVAVGISERSCKKQGVSPTNTTK